jgi:hypothetical protein
MKSLMTTKFCETQSDQFELDCANVVSGVGNARYLLFYEARGEHRTRRL